MSLFVASHYKNSPNDLQMLSDAPAHHIFCLLGTVDNTKAELPEIYCVIQVSTFGLPFQTLSRVHFLLVFEFQKHH